MSGSTGGWDIMGLLGKLGIGSGSPTQATNYTDIAAAMNPALVGQAGIANAVPSSATSVASSISPNWQSAMSSNDWKWPSSKELAETLKGAKGSSSGSSTSSSDETKGSSMIGSSGIHGGSGGISADTVYKLMMARAIPAVGGQQKQGLLGV